MRTISVDDIPRKLQDTVYTAVGLGILGFQQIQVQRQQLQRSLAGSPACEVARQAAAVAREARSQVLGLVGRGADG
ncbi:MAG TPA: hypothetical protein VIL48_11105 [Acidimicrobiales bacterium]